jgi:hypothetical protein
MEGAPAERGTARGAPASAPARLRRANRRWKHARRRAGRFAAVTFLPPLLRLLSRTWRPTLVDEKHLRSVHDAGRGHLLTVWHGRMLLGATHHVAERFCVLVSPSGDGDVSGSILSRLGYGVVRGSSREGATRALRQLIQRLREGLGVVVTPDGPIGPRHSVAPGVAWLARAVDRPVLPCGLVAQRAWHLSSWDRFTIPKPFSRVAFVYGEPVVVSREGGDAELERAADAIRERMLAAERRGFEVLGVEPDG